MNKWSVLLLGALVVACDGREPFKPFPKTIPYLVYYMSRYRGLCVGSLVARTVVITAAVCVTNPRSSIHDTRPITVVTGTLYRHPRRGIRVQITKIVIPKMPADLSHRAQLLEKSPAILMMKRKVPDVLTETPLRGIEVDWRGEQTLTLQEECLITGWHFFYHGDKVYPVHKFLLQRNARVHFVNIVKMHEWCDALVIKLQKSLANIGFYGSVDNSDMVCIKDPDNTAQPCHGMYGAALVCSGHAVGLLMAPDAQWRNCTGYSNLIHLFNTPFLKPFMTCVSKLFETEARLEWNVIKKALYDDNPDTYDYVPSLYDRLVVNSAAESDEI